MVNKKKIQKNPKKKWSHVSWFMQFIINYQLIILYYQCKLAWTLIPFLSALHHKNILTLEHWIHLNYCNTFHLFCIGIRLGEITLLWLHLDLNIFLFNRSYSLTWVDFIWKILGRVEKHNIMPNKWKNYFLCVIYWLSVMALKCQCKKLKNL